MHYENLPTISARFLRPEQRSFPEASPPLARNEARIGAALIIACILTSMLL